MFDNECYSCPDPTIPGSVGDPKGECPKSPRPCGHHCNCIDVHDYCHFCNLDLDLGEA